MQKSLHPLTPQKKSFYKLTFHDQHLLKELSPRLLTIGSSACGKTKLEMLNSPISMNSDLFSQLLQSQRKVSYEQYFQSNEIPQEDSYEVEDELNAKDYTSEQESEMMQDNEYEEDENGMRKRKRKSTAQIKILKKELQVVPNWGKENIAEMSEVTGLSQSQVYKWWWDQKKKNARYQKEHWMRPLDKKKSIKKACVHRAGQTGQQSSDEESEEVLTKPKNVIELQEVPETSKKVNKRLTFL